MPFGQGQYVDYRLFIISRRLCICEGMKILHEDTLLVHRLPAYSVRCYPFLNVLKQFPESRGQLVQCLGSRVDSQLCRRE